MERAETEAVEREWRGVKAAGLGEGLYLTEATAAPPARCWAQETAPAWPWLPLGLGSQARDDYEGSWRENV